ncbi:MAG TPA: cupin domain-containing protein [Candidatus Binatia bacterium]|nr:cupin domain-containing protein [Candidatus Binatia bacterium]
MSAGKPRGPIAIESVPWTEFSEGVRFALKFRLLSDTRKDGRKIGVSYEELPPGKQSVPFHYHMMEEEHIVALQGECTLRLGEERFALKAGEYVCFPAGERIGHCLINETDQPFGFIMIGNYERNEVAVYPDSNKILIRGLDGAILRDENRLPYTYGEKADEPVK